MQRLFLMLALLLGMAVAGPAGAQQRDWRTNVTQLATGYAIGNPAARVKLVEYLSYTCPHCAHFMAESKAKLHDDLVRRGVVRIEVRNAVRDPFDLAATLLARCGGAQRFWPVTEAVFAAQPEWFARGNAFQQSNGRRLQLLPTMARVKALADGSGLTAIAVSKGLTAAAADACLADEAQAANLSAQAQTFFAKIDGTPGFELNGKAIHGHDWATLAPQLAAAGAR